MKKRFGDRYDGYRLRNVDTLFMLIPYIMKTRNDAQVFFEDVVDVDILDTFIRKNQEEIPGLKLYHIIIAAIARLFALRPRLNRFISGSKIFARNEIAISMSIKRSMTDDGEETNVKLKFTPESTLKDVVDIVNEQVSINKEIGSENEGDKFAKFVGHLPVGVIKLIVNSIMLMDKLGIMPKSLIEMSPFHCSGYITNLGSLGIKSVYHHLYNFGTTSAFLAMGKKEYQYQGSDEGELTKRRIISIKLVVDERICDGFYYASSMRLLAKLLQNPELLMTAPDEILVDDGIFPKKKEKNKNKKV